MGAENNQQKEEIPDIIIKTLERQIIESICWDSMEV
jgi:hypothetical protein